MLFAVVIGYTKVVVAFVAAIWRQNRPNPSFAHVCCLGWTGLDLIRLVVAGFVNRRIG